MADEQLQHPKKKHNFQRRFSERKYIISLIAMALVTLGYIGTHFSDRLKDSYFTFIGGIGTVLTLYGAANVGNKWVLAKHGVLAPGDGNDTMVITPSGQLVSMSQPQVPIQQNQQVVNNLPQGLP